MGAAASPRFWFFLWIAVILGAVVPWIGWQDHSHWARVEWVPFGSDPIRPRDILVNVALYVPLGWLYPGAPGRSWRARLIGAVAWALALSVVAEATQIFSHGRFPSATDVVTNVAGAALGVGIARWRAAVDRRPTANGADRTLT
jgi:glycopeptide antibiotics resistance protein